MRTKPSQAKTAFLFLFFCVKYAFYIALPIYMLQLGYKVFEIRACNILQNKLPMKMEPVPSRLILYWLLLSQAREMDRKTHFLGKNTSPRELVLLLKSGPKPEEVNGPLHQNHTLTNRACVCNTHLFISNKEYLFPVQLNGHLLRWKLGSTPPARGNLDHLSGSLQEEEWGIGSTSLLWEPVSGTPGEGQHLKGETIWWDTSTLSNCPPWKEKTLTDGNVRRDWDSRQFQVVVD